MRSLNEILIDIHEEGEFVAIVLANDPSLSKEEAVYFIAEAFIHHCGLKSLGVKD